MKRSWHLSVSRMKKIRFCTDKIGKTWEPEHLRFPGSRDRVIIHRLDYIKRVSGCKISVI